MNENATSLNAGSDWDFLKDLSEDEKLQLIHRLISRLKLTVTEVELMCATLKEDNNKQKTVAGFTVKPA